MRLDAANAARRSLCVSPSAARTLRRCASNLRERNGSVRVPLLSSWPCQRRRQVHALAREAAANNLLLFTRRPAILISPAPPRRHYYSSHYENGSRWGIYGRPATQVPRCECTILRGVNGDWALDSRFRARDIKYIRTLSCFFPSRVIVTRWRGVTSPRVYEYYIRGRAVLLFLIVAADGVSTGHRRARAIRLPPRHASGTPL